MNKISFHLQIKIFKAEFTWYLFVKKKRLIYSYAMNACMNKKLIKRFLSFVLAQLQN